MASHFNILAWRIPWTEEPGGLQSTVSQRTGHNSNRAQVHALAKRAHSEASLEPQFSPCLYPWKGLSSPSLLDNAGDMRDAGSILELGRSPRGGRGNPLQYSCLENPMERGLSRR